MSRLTIIAAVLNDNIEAVETVKSIRATAPADTCVVMVDDCSSTPLAIDDPHTAVIHNEARCGCGPSRHIAAMHAKGDYLLIIDPHMRFLPGWYEEAMKRIWDRPKTIHCATCLGLDSSCMDAAKPLAKYYGATWNMDGPDANVPGRHQVFECVWNKTELPDDAELPAVMGACYFIGREWFMRLSALRYLRFWGGDEQMLSMKSWLAGGDCRLMTNVAIGHKFRGARDTNPAPRRDGKLLEAQTFTVPNGHAHYGKLFAIKTLLPKAVGDSLIESLGRHENIKTGLDMLKNDAHLVAQERARNERLFVREFSWFQAYHKLNL